MDHAVGRPHVGGDNASPADAHHVLAHLHSEARPRECRDRALVRDAGGRVAARGDVIEEDTTERLSVATQRLQRLSGHLLERLVGRREHGVRALARQRLREARALDERDQGVELPGSDCRLHDVLLWCLGGLSRRRIAAAEGDNRRGQNGHEGEDGNDQSAHGASPQASADAERRPIEFALRDGSRVTP